MKIIVLSKWVYEVVMKQIEPVTFILPQKWDVKTCGKKIYNSGAWKQKNYSTLTH